MNSNNIENPNTNNDPTTFDPFNFGSLSEKPDQGLASSELPPANADSPSTESNQGDPVSETVPQVDSAPEPTSQESAQEQIEEPQKTEDTDTPAPETLGNANAEKTPYGQFAKAETRKLLRGLDHETNGEVPEESEFTSSKLAELRTIAEDSMDLVEQSLKEKTVLLSLLQSNPQAHRFFATSLKIGVGKRMMQLHPEYDPSSPDFSKRVEDVTRSMLSDTVTSYRTVDMFMSGAEEVIDNAEEGAHELYESLYGKRNNFERNRASLRDKMKNWKTNSNTSTSEEPQQ